MSSRVAHRTSEPCGCSGSPTNGKPNCRCGCSGCSACEDAQWTECKTGTAESTKRNGVVARPALPARARFFRGELVTESDLGAITDYDRSQQLLANRVIGGWGVYCGYALSVDAKTCCLTVGEGVAFDSKGRALAHCGVCLKRPTPAELQAGVDPCDPCYKPEDDQVLWLAAVYDDCLDAAKPRYSTPCGPTSDPGCDFSRVKERVRFVWLDYEPPDSYWISGCLPDKCAPEPPAPPPECQDPAVPTGQEPRLDQCTPNIGIRGGIGVDAYAQALIKRWNLRRNADLVKPTQGHGACGPALGAILDVLGGVACDPCCGEALVVLAKVTFGPRNAPSIKVEPLRRRVLSNADLTYLLLWLLQQELCPPAAPGRSVSEKHPPASLISCEDPCAGGAAEFAKQVTKAVIGYPRTEKQFTNTYHYVLAHVVEQQVRSFEDLSWEQFGPVIVQSREGVLSRTEETALRDRFLGLPSFAAREESARLLLEEDLKVWPQLSDVQREKAVGLASTRLLENRAATFREVPLSAKAEIFEFLKGEGIALSRAVQDSFLKAPVSEREARAKRGARRSRVIKPKEESK